MLVCTNIFRFSFFISNIENIIVLSMLRMKHTKKMLSAAQKCEIYFEEVLNLIFGISKQLSHHI